MPLFRSSKKRMARDVEAFLDDYEIPSFPNAINDVLAKIRDDETSNSDIATDLEADPGMSIRVLRMVNSAGFGLRHRVDDVSQAVQLIGRSSLESVLITLAMKDVLPMKSRPGFDAVSFWRASAQRAGIAGRLAARLCPPDRSFCWTAALLQDIGVPLLVDYMEDRYCSVLETWVDGAEPLDDLEREAFGFDHAELGKRIAQKWELPERLTEAIADHHASPTLETAPVRLVAFVRPGGRAGDAPPGGISDLIAAAAEFEIDSEACDAHVQEGLSDATELSGLT